MENVKLFALVAAAIIIHLYVRITRATESALWELWPEGVRWTQRVAVAAHASVLGGQNPKRRKAAGVKAPPPAVVVPGIYTSHEAKLRDTDAQRVRWDAAVDAARKAREAEKEAWDVLQKMHDTRVS
jgi:hypothetical protein